MDLIKEFKEICNIEVYKNSNSSECIRCGECIKACPTKAIKKQLNFKILAAN